MGDVFHDYMSKRFEEINPNNESEQKNRCRSASLHNTQRGDFQVRHEQKHPILKMRRGSTVGHEGRRVRLEESARMFRPAIFELNDFRRQNSFAPPST